MSDVASRSYLATPLHARTAELCATNTWTEECGFTVPALYTTEHEEQDALLARVALSDLSARQCWTVQGPDAASFLSVATINDVSRLEAGQTARTLWCDDQGYVRGEGLIACFGKTEFEVWTAVRDFAWFADAALGFDLKLANVTGTRVAIGVRGPLTPQLLAAAGLSGGPTNAGDLVRPSWRPAQVALMRDASGDGLELWTQADDGVVVWDRLWRAGAGLGIAAAGAKSLDTLRIEMATPKAGADWHPAALARAAADLCRPTDLGFAPDLSRRFNGAEALRRTKSSNSKVLVQLTSEQPMTSGPVAMRGVAIGRVASQTWSQTRACAFALGWLNGDAAKIGTKVDAPGASGPVRAEVVRLAFESQP